MSFLTISDNLSVSFFSPRVAATSAAVLEGNVLLFLAGVAMVLLLLAILALVIMARLLAQARADKAESLRVQGVLSHMCRNLQEHSPYPMVLWTLETELVERVNQVAADALGGDRGKLKGQLMGRFWADVDEFGGFLEALRSTRSVSGYGARLRRLDGTLFYGRVSANMIITAEGADLVLMVFADISELKSIENELRLNESRFRVMSDAMPMAVVHTSMNQDMIFANRTSREWFGLNWKPEMEPGETQAESNLAEVKVFQSIALTLPQVAKGETVEMFQDEVLANGKKQHLEVRVIPLENAEQNRVDSCLTLISDITHWKDMELRLGELARTDELTDLHNRRYLYEVGHGEIERALRFKRPLSLVMLDIDNFKNINDRLGHAAGDHALQGLASILKQNSRSVDVIIRSGGEEFIILLPETTLGNAVIYAEKLRSNVQAASIVSRRTVMHITISLGVAAVTEYRSTLDSLIYAADKALYRAKRAGKNRVVVWEEVQGEPTPGIYPLLQADVEEAIREREGAGQAEAPECSE